MLLQRPLASLIQQAEERRFKNKIKKSLCSLSYAGKDAVSEWWCHRGCRTGVRRANLLSPEITAISTKAAISGYPGRKGGGAAAPASASPPVGDARFSPARFHSADADGR